MSFFFAKQNAKKFSDINILHKLECKVCPLYTLASNQNKDIKPIGNPKPEVYILGSSTTDTEDEKGEFFSGSDGKFLKSALTAYQAQQARFNKIARTRDPEGRPSFEAIECCRPSIERDIAETKPKLILGFGQDTLNWALGNKDQQLDAWRGKHFPINIMGHTAWFLPMYDPQYVQDHAFLTHVFKLDITKAYQFLDRKLIPEIENKKLVYENTEILDNLKAIRYALFEVLAKKPFAYIDLETNKDRPYYTGSKILTCAVGCPEYSIAFALEHPQAKWTPAELAELKAMLYEFLCLPQIKAAHNAAFELEWLIDEFDVNFLKFAKWEDTMAAGYVLGYGGKSKDKGEGDESVQRGLLALDNMTMLYFGFFLKNISHLNRANLANEPLQKVLLYNVLDVKYGSKLLVKVEEDIKYEKLGFAYEEQNRRIPTMVLTQRKGLPYDEPIAQAYWDDFSKKAQKSIEECLNNQQIIEYQTKFGKFDLNSAKDCAMFFKWLGYEEVDVPDEKDKKKTKLSSDEEVLNKIVTNHGHPVAKNLLVMREVNKVKSTYIEPFINKSIVFPDGKLHTQFTTMFTTTGRTSSKDPNVQNFPKRKNKDVRKIIIPPSGFLFCSNDYGQIEARVLAMASKDPKFIEALWTGFDIHADWALRLAKLYPKRVGGNAIVYKWESADLQTLRLTDKLFKAFRDIVKNKWVFPSFFGASTKSLSGYMDIPVEFCNKGHKEFWNEFQVIREWQDEMYSFYNKNGYVESLTGRRRYAYMQGGEIINHPIQSTACDIVLDGMNRLSEYALETGQDQFQANINVHDDLGFFLNKETWKQDLQIIIKEMLSCKFDFINVPLTVESAIGPNWYENKEVGTFASNKMEEIEIKLAV